MSKLCLMRQTQNQKSLMNSVLQYDHDVQKDYFKVLTT